MDPASGRKGFMVDIAERIFARAGHTLVFAAVPWSRALMNAENGSNDGVVGIYFSQADDKDFVVPDEELGISINSLIVRNNSRWRYTGVNSLRSMILGVIADYDYGELNPYIEELKAAHSNALQITSGNDVLQQNLRKLLLGRITVTVEDTVVAHYVARQIGVDDQLRVAGAIEPKNRVGIAFSAKKPNAADHARLLSEGIVSLRQSGELKAILDTYAVTDWKVLDKPGKTEK